jgi:hypothetical protein
MIVPLSATKKPALGQRRARLGHGSPCDCIGEEDTACSSRTISARSVRPHRVGSGPDRIAETLRRIERWVDATVTAKSRLGQMIYWSAVGIAPIALAAGHMATFNGGEIEPLFNTAAFALGAWLVGRAARDMLGRPGGQSSESVPILTVQHHRSSLAPCSCRHCRLSAGTAVVFSRAPQRGAAPSRARRDMRSNLHLPLHLAF